MTTVEVFPGLEAGVGHVALVIREASIIEYKDELTPCCKMTPSHARYLATTLKHYADQVEAKTTGQNLGQVGGQAS